MKERTVALVPVMLLVLPFAYAQGGMPDPGMLPDSPFYSLKLFVESIGTTFTFGAEARAERALELAEVRLAEAQVMADMDKDDLAVKAVADYEAKIEEAHENAADIEDAEKRAEVTDRIEAATSAHIDVLNEVKLKVPASARAAIEGAIDASMKGGESATDEDDESE
ncbi:MAG: DUF5667 domain-containing protein [Nitrososphaera sp.]|uniref:DUF5667 domain-containing protein n=1 Tax=Nitrososphaera sp. TaxID=1971748 RepID=UPI0017D47656|nr:DUF5667 domain-containing protein [Nitrososphaera sp.]NWG37809.1 hypothetical protein [Nitrososphaera sp.]